MNGTRALRRVLSVHATKQYWSCHARAIWIVNTCKEVTCSVAASYVEQNGYLHYAAEFESYLTQLEDYDEPFYLTKVSFGLRPAIFVGVFVKRPTTLVERKRIAKALALTQSMMKTHQTNKKQMTTKSAQHRGIQERRSERLHQSLQFKTHKMKICSFRDRQRQNQRQKIDSRAFDLHIFSERSKGGKLSGDSWTGNCVEIYAERSATER